MTADPSRHPEQAPAWWIATDQGVILAGPYAEHGAAMDAHREVAQRLRSDMIRERFPGRVIAQRVRVLGVRWGVRVGAHGAFEGR